MKYNIPKKEGFFWGILSNPIGKDSRSGDDLEASHEYEVMHVVENCLDPENDKFLMVMVPGCSDWEPLDSFIWGPEVPAFKGDK